MKRFLAVAAMGAAGLAAAMSLSGSAASPSQNALLDQSYQSFKASNLYGKYARSNPNEAAAIDAYWANGGDPPNPATPFGKGLALEAQAYWTEDAPGTTTVTTSAPSPTPTPVPPAGEPAPIAGQGYHRVYRDDFTTLDIGSANAWAPQDWWGPSAPAGAITSRNGSLVLASKRVNGYPVVIVSTLNLADKPASRAWKFGYFEARMRWTAGAGAWPGFWLIAKQHAVSPGSGYCSEFDIFEGQGTTPYEMSGALHRNTSNCNGLAADTFRGCWTKPPGNPDLSQWHRFQGVWSGTEVKWYVDDAFLCSQPVYDTTSQDMYLLFSMWIGGWAAGNSPNATTPDSLELEVDYIDVWQR